MLRYFFGFLVGVLSLALVLPLFEKDERVPYCSELFYRQINDYQLVDKPLVGQMDLGDGQVIVRWFMGDLSSFYDILIVHASHSAIEMPDDASVISSTPCTQDGQSYVLYLIKVPFNLLDRSF